MNWFRKAFRRLMCMIGYEPISRLPVFSGYVSSLCIEVSPLSPREQHTVTKVTLIGFHELRTTESIEFRLIELPPIELPWIDIGGAQ